MAYKKSLSGSQKRKKEKFMEHQRHRFLFFDDKLQAEMQTYIELDIFFLFSTESVILFDDKLQAEMRTYIKLVKRKER